MKHKILIIGSGAREHAIIRAFNRSNQEKEVYCLASNMNPGIANYCDSFKIGNINDPAVVENYATEVSAEIAIIGPENPLVDCIVDFLELYAYKI